MAARIDGGGFWRIFVQLMLPMSLPIIVVAMIMQVTAIWNDFLLGLVFAGHDWLPMTVQLNNIINTTTGERLYNVNMAATLLTSLVPRRLLRLGPLVRARHRCRRREGLGMIWAGTSALRTRRQAPPPIAATQAAGRKAPARSATVPDTSTPARRRLPGPRMAAAGGARQRLTRARMPAEAMRHIAVRRCLTPIPFDRATTPQRFDQAVRRPAMGSTPVLEHLDLDVVEGEFLVLLGPSGCGKSTLLHAVAGLIDTSPGVPICWISPPLHHGDAAWPASSPRPGRGSRRSSSRRASGAAA